MTIAPETTDPLFPPRDADSEIAMSDADLAAELACLPDTPDSVDACRDVVAADRAAAYRDVQAHWLNGGRHE